MTLVLANAFEIEVRGCVPRETLEDFEYLSAVVIPAETVISGVLPDQSALYGVLLRLQELGLELVAVRRLGGDAPARAGDRVTRRG